MAVLVTGGTGFTGINIVRELVERDVEVISMDIVPPDGLVQRYVAPWAKRVTWLTGDIADRRGLEAASAYFNIDSIVHSAAYSPYGDTETKNGRRTCDVNLQGTLNMLDLARRLEVKRVIYISSMAVYTAEPSAGQLLKEDTPLKTEGFGTNPTDSTPLPRSPARCLHSATDICMASRQQASVWRRTGVPSRE